MARHMEQTERSIPITGTLRVRIPALSCDAEIKLMRSALHPHGMHPSLGTDFVAFWIEFLVDHPLRFTSGYLTHAQYIDLQAGYHVESVGLGGPLTMRLLEQ